MRPFGSAVRVSFALLSLALLRPIPAAGEPPKTQQGAAEPQALPPDTEPLRVSLAEMRAALRSAPPLAALSAAFAPFTDADADAALRRGGHNRAHLQPYTVLPNALAWRPQPGILLWVLSGRSGGRTVLAVLRVVGSRIEHAASTVVEEPDATLALEFTDQFPKQLTWSTCHGCAGEGGTIRLGDGGRVEITYR